MRLDDLTEALEPVHLLDEREGGRLVLLGRFIGYERGPEPAVDRVTTDPKSDTTRSNSPTTNPSRARQAVR